MKNNPFTHEEINLMSIYNAAGTREGLIAALTEMRGYLDAELMQEGWISPYFAINSMPSTSRCAG